MTLGYPRQLTPFEQAALDRLLPLERKGYGFARSFIADAVVIGEGRWGVGDLVLAHDASPIDLTEGMTAVVAYGELIVLSMGAESRVTISVHTPDDDRMEIQFTSESPLEAIAEAKITSGWTYSQWVHGAPCPASGGVVREIMLGPSHDSPVYILAISPTQRTLWLHHTATGYNQLLPVTGFYEYLLRSHPPEDKKASLTARYLFEHLESFTDEMLRNALMHYNDENPKFDASPLRIEVAVGKRTFGDLVKHFISKRR